MLVGRRTTLLLGSLCSAALLVAPHAATAGGGAKKKSFAGPVTTLGFLGDPATIELKVQFERRDGKLAPVSIADFKTRAITLFCPNGNKTAIGLNPGGNALPGFIPSGGFKI